MGGDPLKTQRRPKVSAEPVVDLTRIWLKYRSTVSGVYTLQYRVTYSHR